MLDAVIIPRPRPALPPRPAAAGRLAGILAAQIALAVVMLEFPSVATAHALVTLAVAIGIAAVSPWIEDIAGAAAYVVGTELLWRITDARVFHEVGKYAIILILGIGLLRLGGGRRIVLPLAYLAMLLPSIALTIDAFGLLGSRQDLSFNLSGPAALVVAVLFCSRLRLSPSAQRRLLWTMVVPIAGIAGAAAYATITAGAIRFTGSSNFVTSAGFGPNQVSAVLGLGALLALVLAIRERAMSTRLLALVITLWMLTQSVLTFSRGGLVNVVVALLVSAAYSLREPRRAAAFMGPVLAVLLVSGLVVYPRLVAYTGGVLQQRFTTFTLEQRTRLLEADLNAFRTHLVFGVGPGVGKLYRSLPDGRPVAAHTEFTRLLAEHGLTGVVAMGALLAIVAGAYRRAKTRPNRAWVLLLASWTLSEMTHGAMRFAAISFVFGLITCTLVDTENEKPRAHPEPVASAR